MLDTATIKSRSRSAFVIQKESLLSGCRVLS